ncbi:MAG: 30S ribosomal protein S1 [Thermoguttaceae bacterium]
MVNRNLIRTLDQNQDNWEAQLDASMAGVNTDEIDWGGGEISMNQIVLGRIVRIDPEHAIVDIGHKSEGFVPLNEWEEGEAPPTIGEQIKVLVEEHDDIPPGEELRGMVSLSRRKAAKIEAWNAMMETIHEGDTVTGHVTRKIKGGLLVDLGGVNVFLPASQVDIRRPNDIGEYIDQDIKCVILKIDEERRNIVVSRRALIENERAERRSTVLSRLQEGQVCTGVVKNIADFGAFIDLGGIDGLLHITDMSWGRINHPSEVVKIDEELEVVILAVDLQREKISLGLKQKSASPWTAVEANYPVGARIKGTVVNVMTYGAFVKLEEGVEGLVHISEMSWTRRVSHPNEILAVGDVIDVVVLNINKDKQEISLGIKQTHDNPWDVVEAKYPVGSDVEGIIRNLTNYGAFVELEEGIDGLLHVSDISWIRKIAHPSEVVQKGDKLKCRVISVDKKNRRIALGLKQMTEDPWETTIPEKYQAGTLITGKVTKITNFGVFVSLGDDLEGLLHISELANHKVENPEEVVKLGEEIEVKILRVDQEDRKIGLSRKRAEWTDEETAADAAATATAAGHNVQPDMLKGGVGDSSGPLFKTPDAT